MKILIYILIVVSNLYSNCESGYTDYSNFNFSNNTIIVDGNYCLYDQDVSVLEDIITQNNLSVDSPFSLGFQTWFEGRNGYLQVGNTFQGGNHVLNVLPETIGNLSNLTILWLEENNLTELPESIGDLSSLTNLVLRFNQVVSLPESIGNLSNLTYLDCGYNALESIPSSIGNLQDLEYLWLFDNNLSSLPSTLCNLDLDWNGTNYDALPYFACGANTLCDTANIPECANSSDFFDSSIDPDYYSFTITAPQDCSCDNNGDINSDGITNILDVVQTVNYILGNAEFDEEQSCNADVNIDGIVNILDVITTVNSILN